MVLFSMKVNVLTLLHPKNHILLFRVNHGRFMIGTHLRWFAQGSSEKTRSNGIIIKLNGVEENLRKL